MFMNNFKNILRNLRKEKNTTQKQLAKELKISEDTIYNWEKGRSEPSIDDLIKISTFFNITIDFLVGKVEL